MLSRRDTLKTIAAAVASAFTPSVSAEDIDRNLTILADETCAESCSASGYVELRTELDEMLLARSTWVSITDPEDSTGEMRIEPMTVENSGRVSKLVIGNDEFRAVLPVTSTHYLPGFVVFNNTDLVVGGTVEFHWFKFSVAELTNL